MYHKSKAYKIGSFVLVCCLVLSLTVFAESQLSTCWRLLEGPSEYTISKIVESNTVLELTSSDFKISEEDALPTGSIVISKLPSPDKGVLKLGPMDVTANQAIAIENLKYLRFIPAKDATGVVEFRFHPVSNAEEEAVFTITVVPSGNEAPVANPLSLETLKDMSITGKLPGVDSEGDTLEYKIIKPPKKGRVIIANPTTGAFQYIPLENEKGVDGFTYQVQDAAGNVSDEAPVTIKINTDKKAVYYEDMRGHWAQYPAAMLAKEGIMEGWSIAGKRLFEPDAAVSKGEFLMMTMSAAKIEPYESANFTGFANDEEIPEWMKGYIVSAYEAGIIGGTMKGDELVFEYDKPITRAEAALIVCKALNLTGPDQAEQALSNFSEIETVPAWAAQSVASVVNAGIIQGNANQQLAVTNTLTRAEAAKILWETINYAKLSSKQAGIFGWLFGK